MSDSAPEHFLTEAIGLLHHQIPVSRSFIPLWWVIATERVRRVLTIHPDFQNLPYNEQQILWRKNQRNATVIVVSRMDALTTGKDQFKNLLGMIDSTDKSLENQISDNVDLNALQVSYLKDPNLNLGKLDETTLRLFSETFREVSGLCFNDQTYQLFVLLTLLDTENLPNLPHFDGIRETRNTYMKLLQKKLIAAHCSDIDFSNFCKTVNKVKIMSAIMDDFLQ